VFVGVYFDWRVDVDVLQQMRGLIEAQNGLDPTGILARCNTELSDEQLQRDLLQYPNKGRLHHLANTPAERRATISLHRHSFPCITTHASGLVEIVANAGQLRSQMWGNRLLSHYNDTVGEFAFARAFVTMLNAKNGVEREKEDLSRLNKARVRRGKRALSEFIVTRLALSKSAIRSGQMR
jgi:hypothetical protein